MDEVSFLYSLSVLITDRESLSWILIRPAPLIHLRGHFQHGGCLGTGLEKGGW